MDGELVVVDLGEHGVQVHEGAGHRDVEGQDGVDGGRLVAEHVVGQLVDGVGLGALRDADGEHVLVDVQHVAALDVEGVLAAVVLRHVLEIRMIVEDVGAVDGLAVARLAVHAVDAHAVADHVERIAGEVQVRHRGAHELRAVGHHVHEQVGVLLRQLLQVDTGHGLHDHVLGAGVLAIDVVLDDLGVQVGADARLVDPLVEELLAQGRVGVQGLGPKVLQIDDLHALLAQNAREGVVLGLSDLQERDVVEQQLLQRVRGEIQKLVPRAMKDNLLEVADLALDVYSLHVTLRSGASAPLDCRLPRFPFRGSADLEGTGSRFHESNVQEL